MKLRNVYSAQVSSTLCQECETCFKEEPQTTNDEACNRSHTRKVNKGDPPLGSQKQRLSSIQQKKYLHDPTQVLSTESKTET